MDGLKANLKLITRKPMPSVSPQSPEMPLYSPFAAFGARKSTHTFWWGGSKKDRESIYKPSKSSWTVPTPNSEEARRAHRQCGITTSQQR